MSPEQLFQPLIVSSGNSIGELDYNLHSEYCFACRNLLCIISNGKAESNSTYFADLDIARCHLMCFLFSQGVDYARNAPRRVGILGVSEDLIGLALGAVSCTFRKEVKPFQSYEMWTRILTWDDKWIYTVTHFVRKDAVRPRAFTFLRPHEQLLVPRQGRLSDLAHKEDAIFASALSKCVWKKGRRTVPPEIMLQVSGLLPPRPGQEEYIASLRNEPLGRLTFSKRAEEYYDIPFKIIDRIEAVWATLRSHLTSDMGAAEEEGRSRSNLKRGNFRDHHPRRQANREEWTWERVEQERQRSMEIAKSLAEMDRLHGEFSADTNALTFRRDWW